MVPISIAAASDRMPTIAPTTYALIEGSISGILIYTEVCKVRESRRGGGLERPAEMQPSEAGTSAQRGSRGFEEGEMEGLLWLREIFELIQL